MQDLPTSEIPPGSRLGKPVLDAQGRVLLRQGALLTEGVIARLQKWQVRSVTIEGEAELDAAALATAPNPIASARRETGANPFTGPTESAEMEILEKAFLLWRENRARTGEAVAH